MTAIMASNRHQSVILGDVSDVENLYCQSNLILFFIGNSHNMGVSQYWFLIFHLFCQ